MSGRQGGKLKPLKKPKKEAGYEDEVKRILLDSLMRSMVKPLSG
jgi:hypothetical protein